MPLPVHPDTVAGLAADCRRVLRREYSMIQAAADADRLVVDDGQRWIEAINMPGGGYWQSNVSPRRRTRAEIDAEVARAVVEYRRVAAMWGVDVEWSNR